MDKSRVDRQNNSQSVITIPELFMTAIINMIVVVISNIKDSTASFVCVYVCSCACE